MSELLAKEKDLSRNFLISQLARFLPFISKKRIIKALALYERFATGSAKKAVTTVKNSLETSQAGDFILRAVKLINYRSRRKIAIALIADGFILRNKIRNEAAARGETVPFTVLISPTMRCNLRCQGCYAGNYTQDDDLSFAVVDRVVAEAEEMGVAFITILGGEPLMWEGMLPLLAAHPDMYFQIYTNSTLITKDLAKKLARLGNAALMLSIEGFKEQTDKRRAPGVFDKVMAAADILRAAKVPFGYSVAVTRENEPVVTSDEFVDMMIAKGALIGWHFLYMPVGKDPDLGLMPTPEQRVHMLEFDKRVRKTKPFFVVDFWNDAPFVGGCIAGKYYAHITSQGWVEPCIFSHVAQDNIKEKSLKEVMDSEFFRELRRRQPYNNNLYLPCMWIDNPEMSREMHQKFQLHLTHPGADDVLRREDLRLGVDAYSRRVKELYAAEWERDREAMYKVKPSERIVTAFGKESAGGCLTGAVAAAGEAAAGEVEAKDEIEADRTQN